MATTHAGMVGLSELEDELPLLSPPAIAINAHSGLTSTHTPSIAPNDSISEYYQPSVRRNSTDSHSTLQPTTTQQNPAGRFRGYPSEEAYLAALRAFIESKTFVEPDPNAPGASYGLLGFYGQKTMEAERTRLDKERAQRKKDKLAYKAAQLEEKEKKRRESLASPTAQDGGVGEEEQGRKEGRRRSVVQGLRGFGRRMTVA